MDSLTNAVGRQELDQAIQEQVGRILGKLSQTIVIDKPIPFDQSKSEDEMVAIQQSEVTADAHGNFSIASHLELNDGENTDQQVVISVEKAKRIKQVLLSESKLLSNIDVVVARSGETCLYINPNKNSNNLDGPLRDLPYLEVRQKSPSTILDQASQIVTSNRSAEGSDHDHTIDSEAKALKELNPSEISIKMITVQGMNQHTGEIRKLQKSEINEEILTYYLQAVEQIVRAINKVLTDN